MIIVCYNEIGDCMGKYSLVVEDTLHHTSKIIDVLDLETKEKRKKVHIKDIDYMTSSFKDKDDLLNHLYNEGIIDFSFGNTYIVTTYKEHEIYYTNIYNREDVKCVSAKVKAGFVDDKDSQYQQTVKVFWNLMQDSSVKEKIAQTKYINKSLKDKLLRYIETMSKEIFKKEELLEQQALLKDIKKELSRYKTYRGIVLLIATYHNEYKRKYKPKIDNQKKEKSKISKISENEFQAQIQKYEQMRNLLNGMTDTERYNREYDEFLSDEEYEEAYHGESRKHHM